MRPWTQNFICVYLASSQQYSIKFGIVFDLRKFWINLASSQQYSNKFGIVFDLRKFCLTLQPSKRRQINYFLYQNSS